MKISIIKKIKNFIIDAKQNSIKTKFCLGIATTSGFSDSPFFSFPRAIENWGFYFHVVCFSSSQGSEIVKALEDDIDSFCLDVEPKKDNFSFSLIETQHRHICFKHIHPNDLTVQACIDLISYELNRSIFIFGHGDLAFKLALQLRTKKIPFKWSASRQSNSKKYQVMKKEFSNLERDKLDSDCQLFVNFSPCKSNFFLNLSNYPDVLIVDVAAKGVFDASLKDRVHILDISARLVNEVSYLLTGNSYSNNFGKSTDRLDVGLVSGGYPGDYGDLVVDNYLNPTYVIGISNGIGGFLKRVNKLFSEDLVSVIKDSNV